MVEKVVNLKVTDNVDQTAKSVGNLKTQLRQAQNEVNELSAKFGATSAQAVEAAKKAAELKDAIGEAKSLTDAFNPDAKFKALTSTLGGVAGGFSAVQGAVGLLGEESQSVEKAILKVQSAMAVSQGIQAIGESVDSFRQLGAVIRATTLYQKALAGATAVQTFVMNGATLAAKALRGALIATGVGALVVGVGLLIANFDKVKKVVMNLIPGLSAVGDVVMSIVNTVTDFIGVTSEAERANEKLKASAAASIALNKKYLAEHGSQLDEFTKQKLAAKDKYNEAIQEENADRVALAKELNRELAAIDKARQDEKDKKAKEAQDKIDEAEKKRKEEAKAERDRLKKEAQDISDNAKKANDEIRKTDLERLTEQYNLERSILEKQKLSTLELETKFLNDKNELNLKQQEIEQKLRDEKIESDKKAEQDYWFGQADAAMQNDALNKEISEADIARQKAVSDAKIDLAKNTLNLVAEIAGEGSDIAKGVAVAQATISGIEGTQNAFTTASKSPITTLFPAYPFIQAGLAGAFSALQIRKIMSTPKSGGGGGSSSSSGSAPTPPQFNIVGQSGTNQLAQTIAGQQNKPIEAFVVSSAVTTSQALDRNRVKTATFGG
ncbi:hypothetical protein UFOVP532_19 [uncultured Caudovirales phage]|uniref:Uncharacterized protein n=1 Tax=uncultured Caudovirales phage TaxID=2100421 RepID=A0A6J5MQA3_9CAUD|nr:hypothetical protein UFOVP532_19 [uncultured Caudovirales phage]